MLFRLLLFLLFLFLFSKRLVVTLTVYRLVLTLSLLRLVLTCNCLRLVLTLSGVRCLVTLIVLRLVVTMHVLRLVLPLQFVTTCLKSCGDAMSQTLHHIEVLVDTQMTDEQHGWGTGLKAMLQLQTKSPPNTDWLTNQVFSIYETLYLFPLELLS